MHGKKDPSTCKDTSTHADKITCFSQGGPLVSLLAPGAMISAAGSVYWGTSQAAPHVAGSIAVLAAAIPTAAISQITYALGQGGPGIIDLRGDALDHPPAGGFIVLDRLDLLGALDALREIVKGRHVVGDGQVELGVNPLGDLNASDGSTGVVGLRYVPTGADALAPGCYCEGWGVADPATGVTGWVDEASGVSPSLNLLDYAATSTHALSKVQVGSLLQVTHDFHPAPATPNLYEIAVTIRNVSRDTDIPDLRYRRVMDWDVPPTAFNEYVTLHTGSSPTVAYVSDDGFANPDPLRPRTSISVEGETVDSGPADHGALFDLSLGSLAHGATRTFTLYYGASGTESDAKFALAAVGAEAYSLGEPSTPDGPTLGTPNTFIFGYKS